MIADQRDFFDIPKDVHYLNCAYMSPLMNSAVKAGCEGVQSKAHPWEITAPDFFTGSTKARELFAALINANKKDIALIPAVSYGTAVAAMNLPIQAGEKILVLAEEFPSNIYAWREKAKDQQAVIKTVERPADNDWTSAILESLDAQVKIVVLPQTHWIDGAQINLELIAKVLKTFSCALVLDLTQSLGVVSVDVQKIQPDFLICASYKWLLGPYSFGFLYADSKHHQGKVLEQGWVNRPGAENFSCLIDYNDTLNPDASRFDVGERSNIQLLPIAITALEQIHKWKQVEIEASLQLYTDNLAERLKEIGFSCCDDAYRSPHYLGMTYAKGLPDNLVQQLADKKIYISQRGEYLRIAPHLYNNQQDIDVLISVLKDILL